MNGKRDHIIGKQSIEINFDSLDDAFGVQDRIAELYYDKLQPAIENLFDEMFDSDHVVIIDRLEVDCETITLNNWEAVWVDTTLRKLKDQLRQAETKTQSVTDSRNEFFYYLEHGYLAWNSRIQSIIEFEKELIVDRTFARFFAESIRQNPSAAKRLVHYFTANFVKAIIEKALEEVRVENTIRKRIIEQIASPAKLQPGIIEALIVCLSIPAASPEELSVKLSNIINNDPKKENKPVAVKQPAKPVNEKNNDDAIYINNAGLVILHPFFRQFFEQLKLTRNDKWIDDQLAQQAVLIMQHLATGLNEFEEFELVLPKIMCGWQPGEVIVETPAITNEWREPCNELMVEVINHWSALKNTGIEAFRNTFIQRRAKLSQVDSGWLLQVEKNSVDILLGSLPWGIGVIRLPWMKELIFTEWV